MSEREENDGESYYQQRRKKAEDLKEKEINPYPYSYDRTDSTCSAKKKFDPDSDEELGAEVQVAGRLMTRRMHGGAAFADLQDGEGQIQIYFSPKYLQEEDLFEQFENLWDVGDIIGVRGELFETGEGEITIVVREGKLLAKGLRPLPEKFHGLKDRETRYRKRSLDLISNSEARETFKARSRFISNLRRQLEAEDFLEVETPMMQKLAGGAEAEPFKTHHNALNLDLYLRIAPELFLKRLLVGGLEKVFEINRNFRNEGISTRHNPEFTMMELYWAYADYFDIMQLTEQTLAEAIETTAGSLQVEYDDQEIDWSLPWRRLTLVEAVREYTDLGVDLEQEPEEIAESARQQNIEVELCSSAGEQILEIFEEAVEDKLLQPTFITEFPREVSPLAKPHRDKPGVCERFEFFAGGLEIGNAYSELNDPQLQRQNFEEQVDSAGEIDDNFLEALEYGMPPAGGLGIGIDRVVMLITNSASIRDVILFPLLAPKS
ncbi:MAG: lysine--tRNA ligase [bacterium]